jgi:uncharacterized phage protein (TIGR01671 family)
MHKTCIKSDGYYISDEQGRQPVYLVEESTVGQFTGLCDRNGKEIYEGDIFEKTAHPRIYRRITDGCGVYSGETFDVHPGVHIRYIICYEDAGFDAKIIYVNPEGVKTGSTLIPQTAIEIGQRNSLNTFFNENRKEEIVGNIHDNPELLK